MTMNEAEQTEQLDEPTHLDRLVDELLMLQEHADKISDEIESIKSQLRDLDPGQYRTKTGALLLVADPPRKFDLERAVELLTLAQRAVSMKYDAAEVRRWLSPVQLDSVMREGDGKRRVYVK